MAAPASPTRRERVKDQIENCFNQSADSYPKRFQHVEKVFWQKYNEIKDFLSFIEKHEGKWSQRLLEISLLYVTPNKEERRKEIHEIKRIYQKVLRQNIDQKCDSLCKKLEREIKLFTLKTYGEHLIRGGNINQMEGFSNLIKATKEKFLEQRALLRNAATHLIDKLEKDPEEKLSKSWNLLAYFIPSLTGEDPHHLDSLAGQHKLTKYKSTPQEDGLP